MGNYCFFSGLPERVSAFAFSWVHQMDLKLCGLKLNKKKSKLEPMQVGQWLSFVIDTIGMQFRVPPEKIAKLKSNLDFIISSRTVTFRDLARVTGLINSLFVASVSSLVCLPGRFMLLSKRGLSRTAHFLFLFRFWRSSVFGFLILRPPTVLGLSQSSSPEQLFFPS